MRCLPFLLVVSGFLLAAWGGGAVQVGAFSQGTPGELPAKWAALPLGGEAPSAYTLVRDGERTVVKAEADNSASGLVRQVDLDTRAYPVLAWRWKVDGVIADGRMDRKSGDDYPARVYVTFDYDPSDLSFGDRLKYEAIRTFTAYDVPLRAINYIWANHADETEALVNPFTDWVMMVPAESGPANVGAWVVEEHNLYEDYRRLFGEEPPPISGVAIMTDADNTGGQATAYYGDIVLKGE